MTERPTPTSPRPYALGGPKPDTPTATPQQPIRARRGYVVALRPGSAYAKATGLPANLRFFLTAHGDASDDVAESIVYPNRRAAETAGHAAVRRTPEVDAFQVMTPIEAVDKHGNAAA